MEMGWYLRDKNLGLKIVLYCPKNRGNVTLIHSRDLVTHVEDKEICFVLILDNPVELADMKLCFDSPCHVYIKLALFDSGP